MEGPAPRKTAQVSQFGRSQRPGNRADARDSFDRVGHRAKEPLHGEIELGRCCSKNSSCVIIEWMSSSRARTRCRTARLSVADFLSALALATPNRPRLAPAIKALQPAQRKPGDRSGIGSGFEHRMGRFAMDIIKMPAKLRELKSIRPVSRRLVLASSG
jgi:hypothetical protein